MSGTERKCSNTRYRTAEDYKHKRKPKLTQFFDASHATTSQWSHHEVESLLQAVRDHGHLNFDEILRALPKKTLDQYKIFLREAKKSVKSEPSSSSQIDNCTDWNQVCDAQYTKHRARHASLELHLLLKLLSIDGVVENHPLPEDAGGVDYAACYRFLSQAVLGHPLQPINEATASVMYEIMDEISTMVNQGDHIVNNLKDVLLQKFAYKTPDVPESSVPVLHHSKQTERQIKTYQRKPVTATVVKTLDPPLQDDPVITNGESLPPSISYSCKPSCSRSTESLNQLSTYSFTGVENKIKPTAECTVSIHSQASTSSLAKLASIVSSVGPASMTEKLPESKTYKKKALSSFTSQPTHSQVSTNSLTELASIESTVSSAGPTRECSNNAKGQVYCVNASPTFPVWSTLDLNLAPKDESSGEESVEAKILSFNSHKVYQRKKSTPKTTPALENEQKVLKDVGLNPLQLPVGMVFNVNYHNYEETALRAIPLLNKEESDKVGKEYDPFVINTDARQSMTRKRARNS